MSMNNGGPAFPNTEFGGTRNEQRGMTLRDYFAAKAMQALVNETHNIDTIEAMAMTAYDYADAMLLTREAT